MVFSVRAVPITLLQARCCNTSSTPRWACGLVLPLPPAGPDLLVRRIELKLISAAELTPPLSLRTLPASAPSACGSSVSQPQRKEMPLCLCV